MRENMKDELARRQQGSQPLPEQNPREDEQLDDSELKRASEKAPGSLGIVPPEPRTDDNQPDMSVGTSR